MKRTYLAAVIMLSCSLSGCASTSGVMPMGPDTFSVSSDNPSAAAAKQSALSQAQGHCASLGKEIMVTNTETAVIRNRAVYDVTFRCLSPGDPKLTRPSYTKNPDVVIEDRRR